MGSRNEGDELMRLPITFVTSEQRQTRLAPGDASGQA